MEYRKPDLIRIGEAYVRFNLEYSEKNSDMVRDAIHSIISEYRSSSETSPSVDSNIIVEIDEGSIIIRIVTIATALYMGIANYGSFRAGLKQIADDVKWFNSAVLHDIQQDPQICNNIIRKENRQGVVARLLELQHRIDKLELNRNNLSPNQLNAELEKIKQEVSNISVLLDNADMQEFMNAVPVDYSANLPQPQPTKARYFLNRYGLRQEEIELYEE